MALPSKYSWLSQEAGPKILLEALKHFGLLEHKGADNNPDIMSWAKQLNISWYKNDATAWCGLFVGICAKRAGFPHDPNQLLAALSWAKWGTAVKKGEESLGDVLVFKRDGGGHVGFYVGENDKAYLVLGGNQSDSVTLSWIAKDRLVACRRCTWKTSQPENVRKIKLNDSGTLSTNEV